MAVPILSPSSAMSTIVLPVTGTLSRAQNITSYPLGLYADSDNSFYDPNFVSGAIDQVSLTYRMLGGDVLDVELTEENVYTAYETAVLEYSYIVNIHQGKNSLPSILGHTTGTFDHDGALKSGDLSSSLSGEHVGLKYPKFDYASTRRVSFRASQETGLNGIETEYSASITINQQQQDYDLQSEIAAKSEFSSLINGKRIVINRVFYKTPHAMWRFYGYFGGMNTVGNMSTYGMYADDSTFEVIPPWQNKLQAMAYEDAIYTRNSHYSFEIKNNKLRIFPEPNSGSPKAMWVKFSIPDEPWDETDSDRSSGTRGINNLNTAPFANIPFENINSIGKQWIRRFALSISKEMLGQIRGKFATIPIPGDSVTLNASDLLSQAKDEQEKLREELKIVLDEMTYNKLAQTESEIIEASNKTLTSVPNGVYVG
tara:strand:+ start:990 stop:2270 length:1281 start_codon:yes stop_codon:yes gene_type:complete